MPDQLSTFLDQAQQAVGTQSGPDDGPKVAFPTDLKLSGEQEKKMIEHAFARMDGIANELGRPLTIQPLWWMQNSAVVNQALASQGLGVTGDTFFGKRSRFDATFYNDVSWRPYCMGPETIFAYSNIAVPVVRRVCRQMIARAKNSFFGTDPWFSVEPTPVPQLDGGEQEAKDEAIERFCQFKLGPQGSNTKEDHGRAISRALILGECPVKTYYVVRDQIYNIESEVLTDITGQPVLGADGNTIGREDQWRDAEDGAGTQVLARDMVTVHPSPDAPVFQKVPLDRRQVLFEGVKSEPIFYKDFLCPLTAPDVQQADCIVHLYDKNVMQFVDLLVKRGMVGDQNDQRKQAAQKIVALVAALADNTATPKAAVAAELRPNENFQGPPVVNTASSPLAEFAEFYMWYDANDDGVAENIMLVADRKTRTPIFYDHVANVTTDGLRPIEIVRINPVEGRWYGQGIMELFESYQTILDLQVNRWNFSQSRAGRLDIVDTSAFLETERDPNVKINYGRMYSLRPGMDIEKAFKSIYLNDIKFEPLYNQIQFFMQLLYNESGIMTANDGQAAGLKSTDLATGVIEATKSGDELFKPVIADLEGPLTRLLNREIDVTLANINPIEVYRYLQGDATQLGKITPDDVRGLKYQAKISLTTHRNQEIVQLSGQAAQLVEKFYSLPPNIQFKVVSFYRQMLRAISPTTDVNTVIDVTMPGTLPAPIESGGAGGGTPGGDGATAAAPAQLIQRTAQPTSVSAPGGTPAAA